MGFNQLRKDLPIEEFDYQLLLSYLEEYTNKRDKITRLIRAEKIIRIKKGLYIFGPEYRKGLVCKEVLANLIYGPSYISFEYALSLFGFIPERVESITSATTGRSRKFDTPIGSFTYRHLNPKRYSCGITIKELDKHHSIMIATPEKAVIDQVFASKGITRNIKMETYFFDDLRVDEPSLKSLSIENLKEISKSYSSPKVDRAVKFIEEVQRDA